MAKVAMIGCGKLGAPCANVMQDAGHDVVGYDIVKNPDAKFPIKDTLAEAVRGRDIIFIAVPTPHDPKYGGETPTTHLPPKDFDYTIVQKTLSDLSKLCGPSQMVVLISTVLPGTNRHRFDAEDFPFRYVYNPYLIAMGSVEWDMVNPEMVIIGTKDGNETSDARILVDFYKTMMQNDPRYVVGTWDEAESIKIFYNTMISAKIALVNTIQDVAMMNGNINVDIVTNALAESTQRITSGSYMRAGMGDAGACHPRDNIALSWLAKSYGLDYDLFGDISVVREQQAKKVAKLIADANHFNQKVYIHGKAYKPNVPYIEGSYSLLIGYYLEELTGKAPIYVDPMTGDMVDEMDGIILMAHHAPTSYSHAKMIGKEGQKFYAPIKAGSTVIDMWRYLTAADVEGCVLIQYGNTRERQFITPQRVDS